MVEPNLGEFKITSLSYSIDNLPSWKNTLLSKIGNQLAGFPELNLNLILFYNNQL